MSRGGQSSVEAVLVATLLAVFGVVAIRLAQRSPARAGPAVQAAARGPRPAAAGEAGAVAIALRLAALGVHEVRANSGPFIDAFTDGHAEPWCADFVSWVLRMGGAPLTGGASGGWRIAGAASLRAWFATRGRWTPRRSAAPVPGDVVVFHHGHAGIVVRVAGAAIVTVEGNAGDAVALRSYPDWWRDRDIAGFGRR